MDFIGNLLVAKAGQAVARRVTAEHPDARVVVNGGNCDWSDINWVHYLHDAWRPDLSTAPRWFRAKERIIVGRYRSLERHALGSARLVLTNSRRTTEDV